MLLIGFTGEMGSGKSTAVETIREIEGNYRGSVKLVKFAAPLYEMQEKLYDIIAPVYQRPADFIKDRKLLQWLGTEWGRALDLGLWGKLWQSKVEELSYNYVDPIILCDDVRFDNEAQRIRKLGGVVVKLRGSGEGRIDTKSGIKAHESEAGISPYLIDYEIDNRGITLEEFKRLVTEVYEKVKHGK